MSQRRCKLPSLQGNVCTDTSWFGGFSWSPDASVIVYVAEDKRPDTCSYFDSAGSDNDKKSRELSSHCTRALPKTGAKSTRAPPRWVCTVSTCTRERWDGSATFPKMAASRWASLCSLPAALI